MYTITVASQKGGIGKSTTSLALASGLKKKGYRVLLIDLDSQGSVTNTAHVAKNQMTAYEVISGEVSPTKAIFTTEFLDIMPANSRMALDPFKELPDAAKPYRIRDILEEIEEYYDFCIIDTPPALGTALTSALTACNGLVIPVTADRYCLNGLKDLSITYNATKKYTNPNIKILGLLITRFNKRTTLSRDIFDMMEDEAKKLGTVVFRSQIRECIQIREAQMRYNPSIYDYAPNSNAAADYSSVVDEILERIE